MTQRLGKQAMIVGVDQPIEIWEREFPAPEPGGVPRPRLILRPCPMKKTGLPRSMS